MYCIVFEACIHSRVGKISGFIAWAPSPKKIMVKFEKRSSDATSKPTKANTASDFIMLPSARAPQTIIIHWFCGTVHFLRKRNTASSPSLFFFRSFVSSVSQRPTSHPRLPELQKKSQNGTDTQPMASFLVPFAAALHLQPWLHFSFPVFPPFYAFPSVLHVFKTHDKLRLGGETHGKEEYVPHHATFAPFSSFQAASAVRCGGVKLHISHRLEQKRQSTNKIRASLYFYLQPNIFPPFLSSVTDPTDISRLVVQAY